MFGKSSKNDLSPKFRAFSGQLSSSALGNPLFNDLKSSRSNTLRSFRATGDSRSNPFIINSSSYKRSSRIGDEEGDKYFRFNLSGTREVEISVRNKEFFLGPSLDFRLLNSRGSTIRSREVDGNEQEEIERDLGRGTYYIKVESDGESVPFRLEFRSRS